MGRSCVPTRRPLRRERIYSVGLQQRRRGHLKLKSKSGITVGNKRGEDSRGRIFGPRRASGRAPHPSASTNFRCGIPPETIADVRQRNRRRFSHR